MSSKKIFVVFGATGAQGGSVIKSVLEDPETAAAYKIRAITRDPSKPSAQALTAKGVECVTGDSGSKDSLRDALKGASAVFAVTNYWETMDKNVEIEQGKNIADVAKEVGVEHLIWSSLIHVTELTGGKFSHVDHFDSKADVEKYIRSLGIPASFFMPGFYMSNLTGNMVQKEASGKYVFRLPCTADTPIPLLDTKGDSGKYVKAALKNPEQTQGKNILAATAYYTPTEIVETLQSLGRDARYEQPSAEQYKAALTGAGMPEFAAAELTENMMFMTNFGYFGKASLDWSNQILQEPATTFKDFYKNNT
ncbi:MAG: hypothetical protein M1833_000191 [Piccolia ochrophora]|nr:MAG: hypothetical protein M1833_000191 [Piccolia ochrophora]